MVIFIPSQIKKKSYIEKLSPSQIVSCYSMEYRIRAKDLVLSKPNTNNQELKWDMLARLVSHKI